MVTKASFVFCCLLATIAVIAPPADALTLDSYRAREQEHSMSPPDTRNPVREVRIYYPQNPKRAQQGSSLLERVRFSNRGGRKDRGAPSPLPRKKSYNRSYSSSPSQQSSMLLRNSPRRSASRRDIMYGVASWYGRKFHGRRTANGEVYNMHAHTAAHRTLPFDTIVRVTNLRNGHQAIVRINDRGPFVAGREIDLSYGVARDLGMLETGLEEVRLEVLTT